MRPDRRFRQRRLTLTPLIDVIFLLLLFFMLSSTFTRVNEINLSASGSGNRAGTFAGKTLFIRLTSQGATLNGTAVALADLGQNLTALRGTGPAQVILSLSDEVVSQDFIDLFARLNALPDLPVTVLQ